MCHKFYYIRWVVHSSPHFKRRTPQYNLEFFKIRNLLTPNSMINDRNSNYPGTNIGKHPLLNSLT